MNTINHQVDFCVVGGGLSGMCAAIMAARHGIKTLLMHERPVLGGNASSEIRMWICGARDNLETGLVEELRLENLYRNTYPSYSVWDSILYEKVRFQENLTLLLNCSCLDAEMAGDRIKSVKGWQPTTQTFHHVEAAIFADCSGDSILAPLTGAEFRVGREARGEFGESIAPVEADRKTMGMSCLIQARETTSPQPYIPPVWAEKYTDADMLPHRLNNFGPRENFWWIELGGECDSIADTEKMRDELLKAAFGVWDYMKNYSPVRSAENWALDWVGFLPGKRESRRYVGDYIVNQNDVASGGKFDDVIAYGGWSMDDHHPAGMRTREEPTIYHPAPSPFGLPFRSLYSKNIENLMFAGRNISVTHSAVSSTRVMATCAVLGQALGGGAALAVQNDLTPRGVYQQKIRQLQNMLMDDDCYLPGLIRPISPPATAAKLTASHADPEPLRNGCDRSVGDAANCWRGGPGDWVEYRLDKPAAIREIRLVFDSDLKRHPLNMPANYPLDMKPYAPPQTLIKAYHLEIEDETGATREVFRDSNNYQRLIKIPVDARALRIRLTLDAVRGEGPKNIFAFEIK